MPKSICEVAQDTRVLSGRLARLAPGELVTYNELTALIGRDVRTIARSTLNSARHIAERDHGLAFGCVHRSGIKRMEGGELPSIGDAAISGIRRKATRASKRMLHAAEKVVLSDEARLQLNARASSLGTIALCSSSKAAARIEEAVKNNGNMELSVSATLAMFQPKG